MLFYSDVKLGIRFSYWTAEDIICAWKRGCCKY